MREEDSKNGVERLAFHRVHGVLPKKYHMKYRIGQEELVEERSLKEIEHAIRQSSEDIDVPEGLLPENIGRKLEFYRKRKRRRQWVLAGAALVMMACVSIFAVQAWRNRGINRGAHNSLGHIYAYDQLYRHFRGLAEKKDPYIRSLGSLMGAMSSADVQSSASMAMGGMDGSAESYTSTNLREEEVGEGDFTVTDGSYIYTLYGYEEDNDESENGELNGDWESDGLVGKSHLKVVISQADGENVRTVGTIHKEFEDMVGYREWKEPSIYIKGDILVLMHSQCIDWTEETSLNFYDVSDRSQPKLLRTATQKGVYRDCREKDGFLYVISCMPYVVVNGLKKQKEEWYVPIMDGEKMPAQDIYLQEDAQGNSYEIISSWNLLDSGRRVDAKALIGYYQNIYMTDKNIYFSNTKYAEEEEESNYTQISKLSCKKGKINAVAMTSFPGTMNSSFAIQEHGEELWVTVQVIHYDAKRKRNKWWSDISVRTFDSRLNSLDSLNGLAKDEEIYAVRYIGETGYFVSYEQIDPLMSVDLSNPRDIRVMDVVVIPGMSMYLHPVQDNLMIGVGNDDSGKIKLDLYDVSNPSALSRTDMEILRGMHSCSVFRDYKWFLADKENRLFGFCASNRNGGSYYFVYHYDREQGLQQIKKIKLSGDTDSEGAIDRQGFRIGTYLYVVGKQPGIGEGLEKGNIRVFGLE